MQIQRKRNDDEDAKARLTYLPACRSLQTRRRWCCFLQSDASRIVSVKPCCVRAALFCRRQEELYSYVTVVDTDARAFGGLGTTVRVSINFNL